MSSGYMMLFIIVEAQIQVTSGTSLPRGCVRHDQLTDSRRQTQLL